MCPCVTNLFLEMQAYLAPVQLAGSPAPPPVKFGRSSMQTPVTVTQESTRVHASVTNLFLEPQVHHALVQFVGSPAQPLVKFSGSSTQTPVIQETTRVRALLTSFWNLSPPNHP